jgi:tetratricopeptide (TPR) repeat protein
MTEKEIRELKNFYLENLGKIEEGISKVEDKIDISLIDLTSRVVNLERGTIPANHPDSPKPSRFDRAYNFLMGCAGVGITAIAAAFAFIVIYVVIDYNQKINKIQATAAKVDSIYAVIDSRLKEVNGLTPKIIQYSKDALSYATESKSYSSEAKDKLPQIEQLNKDYQAGIQKIDTCYSVLGFNSFMKFIDDTTIGVRDRLIIAELLKINYGHFPEYLQKIAKLYYDCTNYEKALDCYREILNSSNSTEPQKRLAISDSSIAYSDMKNAAPTTIPEDHNYSTFLLHSRIIDFLYKNGYLTDKDLNDIIKQSKIHKN